MAFERLYVLRSFDWRDREAMTEQINAALAEHDTDRAAASIACMSNDREQLHILIEHWREDGDSQQDPAGAVDAAPTVRKPRRKGKSQNDDAGAAPGVEPEGVDLPLESATDGYGHGV